MVLRDREVGVSTLEPRSGGQHALLLRCDIVGAAEESGVRFVEAEVFHLWRYMMEHRHRIRVHHLRLCLWLEHADYVKNAELYSHGGEVEDINRLPVYLANSRQSHIFDVRRYVPAGQTELVRSILFSHIPDEIRERADFSFDVTPGVCVEQHIEIPGMDLVLGLSGFEDTGPPAGAPVVRTRPSEH